MTTPINISDEARECAAAFNAEDLDGQLVKASNTDYPTCAK